MRLASLSLPRSLRWGFPRHAPQGRGARGSQESWGFPERRVVRTLPSFQKERGELPLPTGSFLSSL